MYHKGVCILKHCQGCNEVKRIMSIEVYHSLVTQLCSSLVVWYLKDPIQSGIMGSSLGMRNCRFLNQIGCLSLTFEFKDKTGVR
jgi:hypothetical protein